jgi:hypothetical protein
MLNSQDPYAFQNKITSVQNKALEDERMKNQDKEKTLEMQFEEFKRQTKDLLTKEDEYEMKLEQQEKERFEIEQKRLKESTEREEETAKRILQDMQNIAKQDYSYKVKERAIKNEMKTILNDVQQQIQQKRERLVGKLNTIKNLRDLEEKKAANQVLTFKRELGEKLQTTTTTKNPSQCFTRTPSMIEGYCRRNVDQSMQTECQNSSQFCYMCCQNETNGGDNLNCCLNECDKAMQNSTSQCDMFSQSYGINNTQIRVIS